MKPLPRFPVEAVFPTLAGLLWLLMGAGSGFFGFLLSVLPGTLLLAGGVTTVLLPGDERSPQLAALGSVLGLVVAIPVALSVGFWGALLLLLMSGVSLVAAGWTSCRYAPTHVDVPEPPITPELALKVAGDELNLATLWIGRSSPLVRDPARLNEEVEEVRNFFEEQGFLKQPDSYHVVPPPLEHPRLLLTRVRDLRYEELRFPSEYSPREEEPGRERWLSFQANRTAYAWVMRHEDKPRPWLICIHGFGMGIPYLDLQTFRANVLHQQLGLNLVCPVLPLHGPRKAGARSGDHFLGGAFLNTIHAEAQAMWDVRRLLAWIRAQDAPAVGVYGLSLGGYNAALLASLEPELACVIAGIPATDLTALTQRLDSPYKLERFKQADFAWEQIEEILRVVSPLALSPKVPLERRYIFGGAVDRLVPPSQVWALWQHWERPRILWYAGSHVSIHWEPKVRALVREALRDSALVPA